MPLAQRDARSLLALKKQTKLESEAASYVAGALFAIAVADRLNVDFSKVKFKNPDTTFAVAFAIAKRLYASSKKKTITTKEYKDLSKALQNDPLYANKKLKDIAAYDGVAANTRSHEVKKP